MVKQQWLLSTLLFDLLLGRAWVRPTLAWLRCERACVYVCLLACLLGLTTCHKFQMSVLKYFGKIECPRCTCTPAQPYCVKGYCQTVALARKRPGAKVTQAGCVGSTHSNLWINLCMLWVWLSCIAHARVALVAPPAEQIAALTACVVTYICTHGPFSYQICLTIWTLRLALGWCSISLVASVSVRLLHMAAACGTVSLHFPKGKRTAHDATIYSIKLQ